MQSHDGVGVPLVRAVGGKEDGTDVSIGAFPPIDIIVRFWLDAEPEVFTPLSYWLTADVLARASETQADMDEAKKEESMETEVEEDEDSDG
jgi:hypothetical protein